MKIFLITLVSTLILSVLVKAQPQDSLFVIISGDTVHIWNTGAWENCSSQFRMDVSISNDTIYVTEVDTTHDLAYCICYFDLCATVTGLQSGYYNIEVYRKFLLLYPDTLFYIGSTSFNYGGSPLTLISNSYQSDCYQISTVKGNKEQPAEFKLEQNYPNPFNPLTCIRFEIPNRTFISLKVYDILGNKIATLVNEEKPAGEYEVKFNASGLTSGIYFYRFQARNFTDTKKFILIK